MKMYTLHDSSYFNSFTFTWLMQFSWWSKYIQLFLPSFNLPLSHDIHSPFDEAIIPRPICAYIRDPYSSSYMDSKGDEQTDFVVSCRRSNISWSCKFENNIQKTLGGWYHPDIERIGERKIKGEYKERVRNRN